MKLTQNEIDNWFKYEKVRQGGKYNMIAEAGRAAKEAHLTLSDYTTVIKKYSLWKEKIYKMFTEEEVQMKLKEL